MMRHYARQTHETSVDTQLVTKFKQISEIQRIMSVRSATKTSGGLHRLLG